MLTLGQSQVALKLTTLGSAGTYHYAYDIRRVDLIPHDIQVHVCHIRHYHVLWVPGTPCRAAALVDDRHNDVHILFDTTRDGLVQ